MEDGDMRRLIREVLKTSAAGLPPSAAYVEATTQVAHAGMALAMCLAIEAWLSPLGAAGVTLVVWAVWEAVQVIRRPAGVAFWRVMRDSRDDMAAYAAGCGVALASAGLWPMWAALLTAVAVVGAAAWMRRGE
jgi:hypothetical protein